MVHDLIQKLSYEGAYFSGSCREDYRNRFEI